MDRLNRNVVRTNYRHKLVSLAAEKLISGLVVSMVRHGDLMRGVRRAAVSVQLTAILKLGMSLWQAEERDKGLVLKMSHLAARCAKSGLAGPSDVIGGALTVSRWGRQFEAVRDREI
jgi:hypothetical protein